jgi:ubiquitin-protein ligase E3 C
LLPSRLSKEAFDTDRGLWLATAQQELYPNPHSYAKEREFSSSLLDYLSPANLSLRLVAHQLNWYRFLGRVLGKALYEGILVEVAFASFFLGKVLIGLFSF